MDKRELDETYNQVNRRPCRFEKALLTRQCGCSRSDRFWLAEREGVACRSEPDWQRCGSFLAEMRRAARFTLRIPDSDDPLPHAKALRLQMGSVLGLRSALFPQETQGAFVEDVRALTASGSARFGDVADWPLGEILKGVAAQAGRRGRGA
jgi:hypothetical protein